VPCGRGEWLSGSTLPISGVRLMNDPAYRVAANGAWTDDDTFTARLCFYETPFCTTLGLRFAGDALVLDQEMNVGFGPTQRPTLVGLPRRGGPASAPRRD
jgi:hypothetical protein